MNKKPFVIVVVLLLLAFVPALVMANGQAKPAKTVKIVLDASQPLAPQIEAQLGAKPNAPGTAQARVVTVGRGPAAQGPKPNAVLVNLNESFENGTANWGFAELGFSPVGWDPTTLARKRGQYSFYSAAYNNDEFVNPYYDNDMESLAWTTMDLQGARRLQIRFQYMSDTEFGYDYFFWCISPDQVNYECGGHTGSTNDTWRLVKLDSRGDPVMASLLDSPNAELLFVFYSDFSIVDRGTFVDALRIRATGQNP